MTDFIHEHYIVNGQPVVLIMAPDRYPLQTWVADPANSHLVRDNTFIFTIANDPHVQFIPADDFRKFCKRHNIDTTIPQRAIEFTYALVKRTPAKLSNVIPFPVRNIPPRGPVNGLFRAIG